MIPSKPRSKASSSSNSHYCEEGMEDKNMFKPLTPPVVVTTAAASLEPEATVATSSSFSSRPRTVRPTKTPRARKDSSRSLDACFAWIQVLCFFYPKTCASFLIFAVTGVFLFCSMMVWNPWEEFGKIQGDYTHIHSAQELNLQRVDHWCIFHDDSHCQCNDPLEPRHRGELPLWTDSYHKNKQLVEQVTSSSLEPVLLPDVVIYGDSAVEALAGRSLGKEGRLFNNEIFPDEDSSQRIQQSFQAKLNSSNLTAIPLGITGDTSPILLWRLQHGEMPDSSNFRPKVVAISIGMNDLSRELCSEEIVVIGILRIVEEVLARLPSTHVLLNGLFPLVDLRERFRIPNRRHLFRKKRHKIDQASILYDKSAVRKRKPLVAKRKLPLWTSIKAINEQLREFAFSQERVTFLDVTDLFTEKEEDGTLAIQNELISVRGELRVEGYKVWGEALLEAAKKLIPKPKQAGHT